MTRCGSSRGVSTSSSVFCASRARFVPCKSGSWWRSDLPSAMVRLAVAVPEHAEFAGSKLPFLSVRLGSISFDRARKHANSRFCGKTPEKVSFSAARGK